MKGRAEGGRNRGVVPDLFKKGESGFNEEERVNHIVYQLADRYDLMSMTVLFFPGTGDAIDVFAHRGLPRSFIKLLYSSDEKEIMRAAKSGEVVVVAGEPGTSNPGSTSEHATAYRTDLEEEPFKNRRHSMGLVTFPGYGDSERMLISETERLVRESKERGGNALSLPD